MEATTEWQMIILKTIGQEGGYVNDPDDAGGETNWGISKRAYKDLDIKSLTQEEAVKIYKRDYYDPLALPMEWPIQVRWKLFDVAVNMGKAVALRWKELIKDKPELSRLIELQTKRYVDITVGKPTNLKFLKGWVNRAFETGKELV